VNIAGSVGLSADTAREILTKRKFEQAVDEDWQRAQRTGISGVPTFVVDGHKVVGAQPYDVLAAQLRAAGARPRA
jgi:predicted DsbA family dithiol-disulfide isomerase